ncbi:AAA family ATPase [Allomesorhizobium camelthorni]|uniref:AAA family ATPase n=1 Tax=Allomesorhizobium camelthorni TaxID=475069 RepID=A0A6G4WA44_9HYPH|nr:AAA family ATPase [Mesorhizobium camelthorni]NGO51106.1 AAA family ATPase [Mesorhizobium camelthorni]
MRIRRLDLARYGKFTDHTIDFGQRTKGSPDLHIVYGPNEAGKSTALAAVLDLLFGIEMRSPYGFLHPYPSMRLGAALDLTTGEREVFRIKRPQNNLLDADDQPISEAVLRADLGGIDRDSYRTMFSLDDDTLEAGGKSILASEGDLGELLFSASAGLADLSHRLGELRTEADAFYKKRARSGELAELKSQLDAFKEERTKIDTLASRYAQLVGARESAASRYEETIATRGRIQSRIDEIQRLLAALPRLTTLRTVREKLAPLASLPEAPIGIAEELATLQNVEIELATRSKGVAENINELVSELEKESVDDVALRLADRASRLPDLRARYLTAAKDIPERRLQIREADAAITGILRRIGREDEVDPTRLVLQTSVVGCLRELIESRSGVTSSLRSAEGEVSGARRRLDEAREKLEAAGQGTVVTSNSDSVMAGLATALAALRADDHGVRLRLADRALASHQETLSTRLRGLTPWTGDPQQLLEMAVPDKFTVERWKADLATARKTVERHQQEVERLASDRKRLTAELDALEAIAGVVTDHEAGTVRAAREQAWAEHRRKLDESTAGVFEETLRRDDLATNARFVHVNELARLHQGLQAAAVLDADIARAEELLEAAKTHFQSFNHEIAEAFSHIAPGFRGDTSPERLEAWLGSRDLALEALSTVREAERDRQAARADGAAVGDRLTAALAVAGVSHDPAASFEALVVLAQAVVDRGSEIKRLRQDFEDRARELADRERIHKEAAADDQRWTSEWTAACSASWLGVEGPRPVADVREILSAVSDLGSFIEKTSGLADRVTKMERDQAEFAAEAGRLAEELSIPAQESAPLDLAAAIENRIREAVSARSRRLEKEQAVQVAREKQHELSDATAIHGRRKAELLQFFGVPSLSDIGVVLRQLEQRAALRDDADSAAADIINAVGSPTLDEAEKSLENADRAALETEAAELKGRFEDQDQRSRELFTEHSKAADAVSAIGDDDSVARIEERRRTVSVEIEEKAVRYLKLCIGVAAAEQALRIYRDRHRSSMMAQASEAFHTISRGNYRGLATQPDKDTEMLVAVSADGGSKIASALSKGTRFQLYLALRVAGYHEFASSHRPVPFLADDIMETFDDFRAEEAFRLFAGMAKVGQVVYFTHHQHLCDIARKVCPSVTIHELQQPSASLHLVESSQKVA